MKIRYLFTVFVLLIICFGGSCTRAKGVQKHAEKALAATVTLEMSDTQGQPISYGSGFFVSPTYIVTNFHVVVRTDSGTAKLVAKTKTYPIQNVVATDPGNDLAILQVKMPGIKPLPLGDSDKVRIGERVYVTGNPKGLEGTFSEGIISRISDQETKKRLQMTAPISPGSSGGPVLNSKGDVVGVTFMTIIDGQNLNFAIPAKYVKALLDSKDGKKNISAEYYFIQGNKKYEQGLYKSAILDYDTAIWLKPDYIDAYIGRGIAKYELDQYDAAFDDLYTVIELKPVSVEAAKAFASIGAMNVKRGLHHGATYMYNQAIQIKPDYVDAYIGRGKVQYKHGQWLHELGEHVPKMRRDALDKYAAAIADFETAIQLELDSSKAYIGRGTVKLELDQYLEAIADFDKAIQFEPYSTETVEAYIGRGIAKYKQGQTFSETLEARLDFVDALSIAKRTGNVELKNEIESLLRKLK